MGKDVSFTEEERKYIRTMFLPDYPEVVNITKASQLGDFAGLFIENKDDEDGGPLDVSIANKCLTYREGLK